MVSLTKYTFHDVGWCLELDLVAPVIPLFRRVGTRHVADLDRQSRRSDGLVRFIVRENEPPSRLAEL
jgi:hypothetical protein